MPELITESPPSRPELRRRVQRNLAALDPSLRVLAEDVLGLATAIDLVSVDGEGRVVLVLIDHENEDLALLTRALAQRDWLAPRLRDWLKLAPDLGVRPDAPVRAVLLAESFQPETRAAARGLGDDVVQLATYRCVQGDPRPAVLLESLSTRHTAGREPAGEPPRNRRQLPAFRSGLHESDLHLSADELRELDR